MKYTGFIKGSKTLDFQALSAGMIFLEANLSLIDKYFDGNYSVVLFVVIGINVALRFVTKNKLGEKNV